MERFTVDLPEDIAGTMRASVAAGDYASEGDILREAARDWAHARDDSEEIDPDTGYSLGTLRRLIREGDESGPGRPAEEVFDEMLAMIDTYRIQQK